MLRESSIYWLRETILLRDSFKEFIDLFVLSVLSESLEIDSFKLKDVLINDGNNHPLDKK